MLDGMMGANKIYQQFIFRENIFLVLPEHLGRYQNWTNKLNRNPVIVCVCVYIYIYMGSGVT